MGGATVRVVGVAIVHGGRVLAARRAVRPGRPGGWEFPGGKCEPGESLEEAAVREIDEELGCGVRVTGRLDGAQSIGTAMQLEVLVAQLVSGEPVPRESEHDAVRWLAAGELGGLPWLPADVPFLDQLAQHLEVSR